MRRQGTEGVKDESAAGAGLWILYDLYDLCGLCSLSENGLTLRIRAFYPLARRVAVPYSTGRVLTFSVSTSLSTRCATRVRSHVVTTVRQKPSSHGQLPDVVG